MNSRLLRMLQAVRKLNLRALMLKMLHSHMEKKLYFLMYRFRFQREALSEFQEEAEAVNQHFLSFL